MRKLSMVALVCLCACSEGGDSLDKQSAEGCPSGQKDCSGTCVSISDPVTGCGEPTCEPCPTRAQQTAICVDQKCADGPCNDGYDDCSALPADGCETDLRTDDASCGACGVACSDANGGTVTCHDGTCKVDACAGTWTDCNGEGNDGCEANLDNDPEHCSACDAACDAGEQCFEGVCVKNAGVLAWLGEHKGGWCLDDYTKLVNLCGKVSYCHWTLCGDLDQDPAGSPSCYDDYQHEHERAVPFCCDPTYFKTYPDGIAIDIGFYYDGSSVGTVVDLGGDASGNRAYLDFVEPGTLRAAFPPAVDITTPVSAGSHVVSFYISSTELSLYVDGLLADQVAGPGAPIELKAENGPGFVLGARISYWWEIPSTLRFAPFFVHLRNGDDGPEDWDLGRATTAGPATIVLFDESGVSGNEWASSVGEGVGFGVNKADTGVEPLWVGDVSTQCLP